MPGIGKDARVENSIGRTARVAHGLMLQLPFRHLDQGALDVIRVGIVMNDHVALGGIGGRAQKPGKQPQRCENPVWPDDVGFLHVFIPGNLLLIVSRRLRFACGLLNVI